MHPLLVQYQDMQARGSPINLIQDAIAKLADSSARDRKSGTNIRSQLTKLADS